MNSDCAKLTLCELQQTLATSSSSDGFAHLLKKLAKNRRAAIRNREFHLRRAKPQKSNLRFQVLSGTSANKYALAQNRTWCLCAFVVPAQSAIVLRPQAVGRQSTIPFRGSTLGLFDVLRVSQSATSCHYLSVFFHPSEIAICHSHFTAASENENDEKSSKP